EVVFCRCSAALAVFGSFSHSSCCGLLSVRYSAAKKRRGAPLPAAVRGQDIVGVHAFACAGQAEAWTPTRHYFPFTTETTYPFGFRYFCAMALISFRVTASNLASSCSACW